MNPQKKISALPIAGSIDPITSYFPIDNPAVTERINRNTFLEIVSDPVGVTDSQVLTNKTISGSSNTITNINPANVTGLPSVASIVTLTGIQTLTNKTLTAPVINNGSISNSTIAVDAIAEFTPANGVTIDGLNLKDGKLNTNNSVVTANITDGAVTPAKLQSGTGSTWVWQSWTPTWTGFTPASATVNGKYVQMGKTVFWRLDIMLTGAAVGTAPEFSLPVTSISYPGTVVTQVIGNGTLYDANVDQYVGVALWRSTTTARITYEDDVTAGIKNAAGISATAPFTWVSGDEIHLNGFYEAA